MIALIHQLTVESRQDITFERNDRLYNRDICVKCLIGESQVL